MHTLYSTSSPPSPPTGADIDALLVCPRNIDRKDFFDSFGQVLSALPEVKDLRVCPPNRNTCCVFYCSAPPNRHIYTLRGTISYYNNICFQINPLIVKRGLVIDSQNIRFSSGCDHNTGTIGGVSLSELSSGARTLSCLHEHQYVLMYTTVAAST